MVNDLDTEIAEAWADLREMGEGIERTLSLSPARRIVRSTLTTGARAVVIGTYNRHVRFKDFHADVMFAFAEQQARIEGNDV